jgi:hypothetical protein
MFGQLIIRLKTGIQARAKIGWLQRFGLFSVVVFNIKSLRNNG